MDFWTIFSQVLVLFLLILVGYIAGKQQMITKHGAKEISTLVLYITLPALIIRAMQFDFSIELLGQSLKMIGMAIAVYAATISLSYLFAKLLRAKGKEKDVFQTAMIFPNVGFMGYPITQGLYGTQGIFYTSLFNMPFDLLMWTVGVHMLSRSSDSTASKKKGLAALFNPGTIAVAIGFTLFILSIKLPPILDSTLLYLASATTPLAMLAVGSTLARTRVDAIFANKKLLLTAVIKVAVIPAIMIVLFTILKLDGYFLKIPIIITAMPVAANVAIFATRYESDELLASQLIFLTTLMSLVTIPLIALFLG